jgi:hypothetical protein
MFIRAHVRVARVPPFATPMPRKRDRTMLAHQLQGKACGRFDLPLLIRRRCDMPPSHEFGSAGNDVLVSGLYRVALLPSSIAEISCIPTARLIQSRVLIDTHHTWCKALIPHCLLLQQRDAIRRR